MPTGQWPMVVRDFIVVQRLRNLETRAQTAWGTIRLLHYFHIMFLTVHAVPGV